MKPGEREPLVRFNAEPMVIRAIEDRMRRENISKAEAARRFIEIGIAADKAVRAAAGTPPPGPSPMSIACTDSSICNQPLRESHPGYYTCAACSLWEGARTRRPKDHVLHG